MDKEVLVIVMATAIAALLVLVWCRRVRRRRLESPEERYRRDLAALAPRARALSSSVDTDELWSAGAASTHSKSKKAGSIFLAGIVSAGCGGCGGCGCGG